MKTTRELQFLFLVFLILSFCSCGRFLSDLRHDPNDPNSSELSSNDDLPNPNLGREGVDRENFPIDHDERKFADELPDRVYASDDRPMITSRQVQTLEPEKKRLFRQGSRVTREDFIDQSQEEGSLWASNGQTNYYFTKNKIRSPGDIISISIEHDLAKEFVTEIKKSLSPKEKTTEIRLVQDQIRARYLASREKGNKDNITLSAAAPEKASSRPEGQASPNPAQLSPILTEQEAELKIARTSFEDVDLQSALGVKAGETMMGEIVDRYPNGNYKVRASKKVPYKRGSPRIVSVLGVVKSTDVNEETDIINSGKLYEYRVEISY